MSDQPKPATGEWTPESVFTLYGHPNNPNGWQAIADAHNAAIADARTEQAHDDRKHWEARVYGLEQQLAAAWRKGHADAQEPALKRIDELIIIAQCLFPLRQLRDQLAVEREKVQTLVDALTSIATDQTLWGTIARQALAKVKE
jgi:hypothetical protein